MFKSDVTQTYNQQDATLEILVMLAGAFLLGCLLCWLLRKLFSKGDRATTNNDFNHSDTATRDNSTRNHVAKNANTRPQTLTSSNRMNTRGSAENKRHASLVVKHDTDYNKPRTDDLTKISGINSDVQSELKNRGINSYIDLRDSDKQSIIDTLESPGGQFTSSKEAQTWPHQASLAAKGEWEKLTEYQEFMKRTQEAAKKAKNQSQAKSASAMNDDLKKIEGIGPKIEEILNNKGIKTFKALSNTDRDTIKSHLDEAGSRFKMHEPKSWPHQAGMADRGEWDELKLYQEFMDSGRDDIPSASASSSISTKASSEPELSAPTHFKSNLANQNDDLKKIEGIGPKIEELLNKADINTFEDLKNSDRNTIKSLLDKAGPQYRMHEPETWPEQAKLAFEGEWDKLKEYQDFLIGGRG